MDAREGQKKFRRSDRLYREGRYQEALDLLGELNQAYPNAKNVMYPAAMCLEKLGRPDEALPYCEELIRQYQDPRAEKLKARIEQERNAAGTGGANDLDRLGIDTSLANDLLNIDMSIEGDALGLEETASKYKPVEPDPFPWLKYGLIALGTLVVLAAVIVPLATYEPPPPNTEPAGGGEAGRVNTAMIYVGMFAAYLVIVGFQTAGAYLCLMLQRALPHEDFWGNFFNISVSMFLATLLESSFFGLFVTGLWFSKAYDLSLGALFVLYIFRIVFGIVGFVIGMTLFVGSVALVFQNALPA